MDPIEFQARWQTGGLSLHDVETAALAWYKAGHTGPAVQELAWPTQAKRDIHPRIAEALTEMGQRELTEVEARMVLTRLVAKRVVAGELEPLAGAEEIWFEVWPFELRDELPPAVERLYALMQEAYQAGPCDAATPAIAGKLRAEAAALLTIVV